IEDSASLILLHSALRTHHFLMSILERIRQRAAADPQHIVLPEGEDPRTTVAASMIVRDRLARVTVIGDEEKVRAAAREAGADLGGVAVLDHLRAPDFEKVAALYHELRRAKGLMPDEARIAVRDPLYYGNLLAREGRADGSVAGATNTPAHTPRAPRPPASASAPDSRSSPASSSWFCPGPTSARAARSSTPTAAWSSSLRRRRSEEHTSELQSRFG